MSSEELTSADSFQLNDLVFLFSHGAGAGIQSDLCQRWIRALSQIAPVIPLQYAYLGHGRRRPPPPLSVLVDEHVKCFRQIRAQHPNARIVMVGRSMGSRVACHASLEDQVDADAIVCLSYPLIAAGAKRTRRDEILRRIRIPVLFVTGSRDAMCPIADLQVLTSSGMHCRAQIQVVDGAGHDLRLKPKERAAEAESCCLEAIREFLQQKPPK